MSVPILVFSALVLASTVAIVAIVALFVQVLRRVDEPLPRRIAMAVLLPWGALESWRRGRHLLPALALASLAVYTVLRVASEAMY